MVIASSLVSKQLRHHSRRATMRGKRWDNLFFWRREKLEKFKNKKIEEDLAELARCRPAKSSGLYQRQANLNRNKSQETRRSVVLH
jgi:hypothetical protein